MKKANNFIPLDKPVTVTEQVWTDDTIPVVSVFNWVYNHNEFIRESIESILFQKTAFPIEIIIHDDASNDGTKQIILEYQNKHPPLFRNIIQKENQWSQGKSVMTPLFEKPRGKYIALSHGDDYWTDPYKLQKQVDFLEANKDYVASFHDVQVLKTDGILYDNFLTKIPKSWETAEDLALYGQYIQTNTFLFRNVVKNYPEIFIKYSTGDFALQLYVLQFGKIKYFSEVMSVYRYQVGIHSTLTAENQNKTFHLWLLPLWIYFYQKGNLKIANILMYRIYYYMDSIKNTDIHKEYVNYLYDGLGKDLFGEFLNGTNSYFNKFSEKSKKDYHDSFMRNASILYLLKVIYYKIKQKLGLVNR